MIPFSFFQDLISILFKFGTSADQTLYIKQEKENACDLEKAECSDLCTRYRTHRFDAVPRVSREEIERSVIVQKTNP